MQLTNVIGRENKICDLAVLRLASKCKEFEDKYNLSSNEFYNLFQQGKMGDDQDFFEWKALIEGVREWEETKQEINKRLAS